MNIETKTGENYINVLQHLGLDGIVTISGREVIFPLEFSAGDTPRQSDSGAGQFTD